ncbi:MAG: prenyltransferase/squalene oxidase repeat-containing protein [Thermoguttaceae bacterium]|jgi:hypothetical protein
MAETANNPLPAMDEDRLQEETLLEHFKGWVRTELVWYAGSFSFHLLALSVMLLLPGFGGGHDQDDTPTLVGKADEDLHEKEPGFDKSAKTDLALGAVEETPASDFEIDPTPRSLARDAGPPEYNNEDPVFEHGNSRAQREKSAGSNGGGALGFLLGPRLVDPMRIGRGPRNGMGMNSGGDGFGEIGRDNRIGGTRPTERAVNAALVWLASHQLSDGSWSLQNYTQRCNDKTCTGPGNVSADAGATAMGLLPFLAIGQTHKSQGRYKEHVLRGVQWLIRHQQADGNLAKGAQQMMYSHGLATIALCEAYGLSADKQVGVAAQGAVNFILSAQNTADGGWRYNPNDPGDTSVFGWQLMALKSAHMAGLNVGGSAFSSTSKWLDAVAVNDGTEYAYQPGQGSSIAMTSVGLLCRQYLGAKRDNPVLTGGMSYLMNHLPEEGFPNVYYWYYATQVMHNMSGPEWDTWNRKMRDLLVRTQVRNIDECANGSWAPEKDAWGKNGGRLMTTSLSTLTLEVYYRYLPLFKTDEGGGGRTVAPDSGERPSKAAVGVR